MGFSFEKFAVKPQVTRRFSLDAVSEDPKNPIVLIVRAAGQNNVEYRNHSLKVVSKARDARARSSRVTPDLVEQRLRENAEAYSRFVIVGWENVLEDGKPAPFSPDACLRFLEALLHPTHGRRDVWFELSTFCEDADNFSDGVGDPAELGKA